MSVRHTTSSPHSSGDPPAGSRHAVAITLGCAVGVVLVGVVDLVTGIEARVYPLYYLPIALGAQRASLRVGLLLSVLSTTLWTLAMLLAGSPWSTWLLIFNAMTQLLSFGLVAILVAGIARRFEVERNLSRRDNLTDLPNRRLLYEVAELVVAGARRSSRPFTIAYVDLDNFKGVNDELGHLQGDLALKEFAGVLHRSLRASDVAARMGGDEFAILLPDTGLETARGVLQRLAEQLAQAMSQRHWPITASIGAISYLRPPATVEEAIHDADALMYRAKQAGKNRVLIEAAGAEAELTGR